MFLRISLRFLWLKTVNAGILIRRLFLSYKRVGFSGNTLEMIYYSNIWSFRDCAESMNEIEDEAGKTIANRLEQIQRIYSIRRHVSIYP